MKYTIDKSGEWQILEDGEPIDKEEAVNRLVKLGWQS